MAAGQRLSFIMLWKLNDWGLYNRRNEALLAELASRDSVESVLHVEHITMKQLMRWFLKWLQADNSLLRRAYKQQMKKAVSLRPVSVSYDNKYFVSSVVDCYNGKNSSLRRMSRFFMNLKYRAINKYFRRAGNKIVLMAYPPLKYLPEAVGTISHDLLISDIVDDDIERACSDEERDQRIEIFRKILPQSSCIFATSPEMHEEYGQYAKCRIDFLPNAVDMNAFSKILPAETASDRNRKVAGYIGAINKSMDTELLEHILSLFPGVDFVLIGFCRQEQQQYITRLSNSYDNFHFLGERNHLDVPGYLSGFDVLINFKKNDHRTSGNNSLKIYEYLATGNPIVTTPVPPAEQFKDIIYVAYDKVQFAECLKKALEEDQQQLRNKRKEAALSNSWADRADTILAKISGLLNVDSRGCSREPLHAKAGK